ncbi:MAG: Gfo/Idh/MocA family oxidoreductase [Armatimonadota bacterium]|nr:MAG: Gfo/Idh/MocA family oxidoreductase [Armatimonadota bacterium]
MPKKRFALIGAGLFGEIHAKAYSAHPEVEFAAVCDLDEARAKEIAERYGAAKHCTDWREVVQEAGVDAVSVATPDFAHAEIAIGAAEAGKHLLVEKPLAATVRECEQIISAAKEQGVKLMVDFHNRWSPAFHEAHRLLREGALGTPRFVYFRLSNTTFVPLKMLSWAERSSPLWFLGSHAIDIVCWLAGEYPERVYSAARRGVLKERGVDAPDLYQSTLEFPSGTVASIENCWLLPESAPSVFDLKCEIVGSEATINIDTSSNRTVEVVDAQGTHYAEILGGPLIHGKQLGFMVESIRHFADCVIHDREPLVSGEVGLEVTRVACAIEESAERGEPVVIVR